MKSILVIGMGRFGRHLSYKMKELGNDVMIVDKDTEIIGELADDFTDAYIGDCSKEGVIRSLGVRNFDICYVTIGEDFQSSLIVTSYLKKIGAKYVVTKARTDIQAEILGKIGADEVVYPERDMAEKIAVMHNANNIFDYIELTSEYAIYEVPVIKTWIGKTVIDVDIRKHHNVNVIAVKNGNMLTASHLGEYVFKNEDVLVVIGKSTDVFKLAALV